MVNIVSELFREDIVDLYRTHLNLVDLYGFYWSVWQLSGLTSDWSLVVMIYKGLSWTRLKNLRDPAKFWWSWATGPLYRFISLKVNSPYPNSLYRKKKYFKKTCGYLINYISLSMFYFLNIISEIASAFQWGVVLGTFTHLKW